MSERPSFNLFINGKLRPAEGNKTFDAIDPSTGQVFALVADASAEDMQQAIAAARTAFDDARWSGRSLTQRGQCLKRAAKLIRDNAKELADLESRDTGKTGKQTTFIDVPTVADTFDFFAKAENFLLDEELNIAAPVKSTLCREPIGVVGCLIPWNYPLIMAGWKMAPALIAGNTVVFRPSSTASVAIMKLAQILKDAGFPDGVVNIVPCRKHKVADLLVTSPDIDMVTFTGGSSTGEDIMRQAAPTTKKLSLELGGKSPNIVFADCQLEAALGGTLSAIFMNQGQMCTAGSRLFVEDSIYDDFVAQLVEKATALKIGPGSAYDTDFGPLISERQRQTVLEYIQTGIAQGAALACGGHVPEGDEFADGFYLQPTIFTDVRPEMTICQEEIFGPVLCVMKFSSEQEAVRLANDTCYGLAACVWSGDAERADRVARQLRCGTVWVNTYGGFYNEAPFGGYKRSGFGRELGRDGLQEYTQAKHICRDTTPGGMPLVSAWF